MKKSLFALAALGAFAGAAQAQSSVTLFGTIDASIQYIQNGGVAGNTAAAGSSIGTGNSITNATLPGPNTGSNFAYYDSAIASSQWGMRGTEDLGGGMKANFYLAGDANTNNGGTHIEGLFRRGAWVGMSGNFGEFRLGTQANPIVTATGALMPVSGNTVNSYRSIWTNGKDYNRNAIGYMTPTMGGFMAELQYAANNTIDGGLTDGTRMSVRGFYSKGPLDINAAYLKATSMAATGNAAAGACTVLTNGTAVTCPAAVYGGDTKGYVLGAKYKVTPAIQLGLGFAHGENDSTNFEAGKATPGTAVKSNANAFMFGVGYQVAPAVLLGLSYIVNTADSNQTNFQTRYALSKRTTAYFQANMVRNGAGTVNGATTPYGNIIALGGQTNTSPSEQVQGMKASAGLPNTTTTAIGVGMIHNF